MTISYFNKILKRIIAGRPEPKNYTIDTATKLREVHCPCGKIYKYEPPESEYDTDRKKAKVHCPCGKKTFIFGRGYKVTMP